MMEDVIRHGTATKALQLGRTDIAGKTGTTNDHFDAWFTGYSPKQVAVAWIGYDKPQSLGRNETGGSAALPIWIKYMATALKGVPDEELPMPDGILAIKIDPTTGIRADNEDSAIYDYFYHENPPPQVEVPVAPMTDDPDTDALTSQAQHVLQPEVTHATPTITPNAAPNRLQLPPQPPQQPAKRIEPTITPNVVIKPLNP
jgi:penicillin-binding protein 1A